MMAFWLPLAGLPGVALSFCADGIGGMPDFAEDNGSANVDVIVVQAALMSVNPKIGTLFGHFNWYHSALVFKQANSSGQDRYWTLEFDAATKGSTFAASIPSIDGDLLKWGDTDARFCLTDGLLWGREHWKKSWETVMTMTAEQARRTFNQGVSGINATAHGKGPQYQLFAIEANARQGGTSLLDDLTCGDGVSWFLYYAVTLNDVVLRKDYRLKTTKILIKANDVVPINSSSPEWHSSVVHSYKLLSGLFTGPLPQKPLDFLRYKYAPANGLYDANSGTYYKIEHRVSDSVHFEYKQRQICSPPWVEKPLCLQYLPAGSRDVLV